MEPQVDGPTPGHQPKQTNDTAHDSLTQTSLNIATFPDRTRVRSNTTTPLEQSPTSLSSANRLQETDLLQRSFSVANGERRRKSSERLGNGGTRERRPEGHVRRPSEIRHCGKCGGRLTGQFVRALEDTFHLECFTCRVSGRRTADNMVSTNEIARIVARLSRRNSFPFPINHQTNTLSARPTTSDGSTFCVTNAVELYEDLTSQH